MAKADHNPLKIGRGRPRPMEAIARDEAILKLLKRQRNPMTRNQIAETLQLPLGLVYLSLDRLRKEGKINRIENDSRFTWQAERS